jgi:hypothetical protein
MKAFPNGLVYGRELDGGMDLRDYFAAKAMQQMGWNFYYGDEETKQSLNKDAEFCYLIADAMMEARKK